VLRILARESSTQYAETWVNLSVAMRKVPTGGQVEVPAGGQLEVPTFVVVS
jgi:hypothetical protein